MLQAADSILWQGANPAKNPVLRTAARGAAAAEGQASRGEGQVEPV